MRGAGGGGGMYREEEREGEQEESRSYKQTNDLLLRIRVMNTGYSRDKLVPVLVAEGRLATGGQFLPLWYLQAAVILGRQEEKYTDVALT